MSFVAIRVIGSGLALGELVQWRQAVCSLFLQYRQWHHSPMLRPICKPHQHLRVILNSSPHSRILSGGTGRQPGSCLVNHIETKGIRSNVIGWSHFQKHTTRGHSKKVSGFSTGNCHNQIVVASELLQRKQLFRKSDYRNTKLPSRHWKSQFFIIMSHNYSTPPAQSIRNRSHAQSL